LIILPVYYSTIHPMSSCFNFYCLTGALSEISFSP
jgi:hypothetical protein